MMRRIIVVVALLALSAAPALALERGGTMLAVQLSNGTADLYTPEAFGTAGFISAYDHSELGVQAQIWHMLSDDYALALGGGIGFFSETNEPGNNALPGTSEFKYTQSSWHLRLGGDRMVKIADRATLYFGPGIEFWNGKAKFEQGPNSLETESITRVSFSGRIGGTMSIGPGWGLTGHIGHLIGHASAKDLGAKATWWPSSFEAAGGIAFEFGGK